MHRLSQVDQLGVHHAAGLLLVLYHLLNQGDAPFQLVTGGLHGATEGPQCLLAVLIPTVRGLVNDATVDETVLLIDLNDNAGLVILVDFRAHVLAQGAPFVKIGLAWLLVKVGDDRLVRVDHAVLGET